MITRIRLLHAAPVTAKDFERVREEIQGHVLATDPYLPRSSESAKDPGEERWQFCADNWRVTCDGTDTALALMLARLKPFKNRSVSERSGWKNSRGVWMGSVYWSSPTPGTTKSYTQAQLGPAMKRTPELVGLVVE